MQPTCSRHAASRRRRRQPARQACRQPTCAAGPRLAEHHPQQAAAVQQHGLLAAQAHLVGGHKLQGKKEGREERKEWQAEDKHGK